MRKKITLKPVLLVELLMVALLLGVGSAFAMNFNTITPTQDPWAGQAQITVPAGVSVDDYWFDYDADIEDVTELIVDVTGSGNMTLTWVLGNGTMGSGTALENGEVTQNITATPRFTITLAGTTSIESVDYLRVILEPERV